MEKDLTEVILNPVRMRIIQYLIKHGEGTASQISGELSDIPKASLYRHIKTLAENGMIKVDRTTQRRGALEKTYKLEENPFGDYSSGQAGMLVMNTLMLLMREFNKYFSAKDAQPQNDLVMLTTTTILVTEEEFHSFLGKIGETLLEIIDNQPDASRKVRRFTMMSSIPADN